MILSFEEISQEFIDESNSRQLCQTMPLSEKKQGGPYSKESKQKRRDEVYRLHFELGYSARKTSDAMKINRNTINADVKFWYQELAKSLEADTVRGGIARQLARYESQASRLTEKLESCNDIGMQLNIEKLIVDISSKASTLHLKILDNHAARPAEAKSQEDEYVIDEKLIRHIILFLALKYARNPRLGEKSLKSEIINLERCTVRQAESIYSYMHEMGLHQCSILSSGMQYDLLEFALLRRYVMQNDSFVSRLMALCMMHNAQPLEKSDVLKRFKERHGSRESWDEQTHERYSKEIESLNARHAGASAKIFAEAFEGLDYDGKKFDQYSKYVAVRFADDNEKQLFQRMLDE